MRRDYSILLAAILPLIWTQANALPFAQGQLSELSDQELGQLRGRYAAPGVIMNFGVELATHWQTGDGRNLDASVNLAVDSNYRPSLSISTQYSSGPSGPNPTGSSGVVVGNIGNVSGVEQSIRIAGDGNSVKNTVSLDFSSGNSASSGSSIPIGSSGSVVTNNEGAQTMVSVGAGGLMLSMSVPGQGLVTQLIRDGQLSQQALIGGDFNHVYNSMSIHGQIQAPGSVDAIGTGRMFQLLNGLR